MKYARAFATIVLFAVFASGISLAQQLAIVSQAPTEALKTFLRGYLNSGRVGPDRTTRIVAANLSSRGETSGETLVYVSGERWCGSGGCTLLILESKESSFKVLGRIPIVQLPVRLLPSTNRGLPDIGVRVQGGGLQAGYEAVLSFNGTEYPRNPSLPPARRLAENEGKVMITKTDTGIPLYD